jgi:UDP-glucose 4-epimerase
MSRILVTGGAGFIGSSLIDALMRSKEDHQVIAFDNLSRGRIENISNWLGNQNFTFIQGDMLDHLLLENAVEGCDTVFHLAANPIVALGTTDSKTDYQQNLLTTYNLLEAMKKSPGCKKVIFTSTSAVYGEAKVMPTAETYSPLKPISLYGATKLACEAIISGYCHMFDMSSVIVRLANIIGPVNTHGVIYDFLIKLKDNPTQLDVLGNGKQNKSYLYIEDCTNALIKLLKMLDETSTTTIFEIFNIGSDDTITVLEIADIIIHKLSLSNVKIRLIDSLHGRGWKGDVKEYLLDSSKLKTKGWKAEFDSRNAVIRTVEEFLNQIDDSKKKTQYQR